MSRRSGWTCLIAVSLILGWTAAGQAASADAAAALVAAYQAVFVAAVAEPRQAEPEPVEPEPGGNIYCCTHTGACVSTSAEKCTKAVADGGYGGTVHDTLLECKRAGCS